MAEKLGIPCYDQELIEKLAQASGFTPEMVAKQQEASPYSSHWAFALSEGQFMGASIQDQLWQLQRKIILELAEKESCVIVGKCADYVLKGRKNVVSIYIEAPRAFCLERTMQRMKVSADVAAATIENTDKYRADYYKYYTKGNYWTNPVNYDMTLNSEKVGIAGCVKMIEEYLVMKGLITREQILSEQITKGEEKK